MHHVPFGGLHGHSTVAESRDLGRNGAFLVARQLHQDVARFREETAKWGGAHGPHGLAARMVGRSKDGLPLAEASSSNPANDTRPGTGICRWCSAARAPRARRVCFGGVALPTTAGNRARRTVAPALELG